MYFDTIRLKGNTNTDLRKENADPKAKYFLKDVVGLGPPEINVLMKQSVNGDGVYQESKPALRQIVVRVGLRPDYKNGETVSDLRTALYSRITSYYGKKSYVQLRTTTPDVLVAQTQVYISRFEIAPLSKDPEIQITYECTSPYLDAGADVVIPPGLPLDKAHPIINNPGSAPCGFQFTVTFLAHVTNLRITSHADPSQYIQFNGTSNIGEGLFFDTRPGYRAVKWVAIGSTTPTLNLLIGLDPGSTWLMLDPGDNQFDTSDQRIDFAGFTFTPKYWGI